VAAPADSALRRSGTECLAIGFCNAARKGATEMNNIFYIIGVVVVVLIVLGYFGLR
jgi:predicted nucleic acid-binding Zn ribbon protein